MKPWEDLLQETKPYDFEQSSRVKKTVGFCLVLIVFALIFPMPILSDLFNKEVKLPRRLSNGSIEIYGDL